MFGMRARQSLSRCSEGGTVRNHLFFGTLVIVPEKSGFGQVQAQDLTLPRSPFSGNEGALSEKQTIRRSGSLSVSLSALAIWPSSRRIPPKESLDFTRQESGAHSFGHLP